MELFYLAVLLLMGFAVVDLMVGVSNDAVNFLNSSLGSRVAPRYIIMIIASLGIIAGVMFSSGMMEVARKGIFHPQLFTMPELLIIFLAVMITDIILLDLFNTYALPTSTTVSIVFELLGAAVAISVLKILQMNSNLLDLVQYINTAKAMFIIFGILLSIVVAFICGAVTQFICRLIFTFDYAKGLRRYGALWGGIAMASITYFILVKGAQGASFISPETVARIRSDTLMILLTIFSVSAVILQFFTLLRINILKPVVLVGTFALAMSFAANDLVNFIGVPLAGMHAYEAAVLSNDPLNVTMVALSKKVQSETFFLLIAGLIMVITLWFSKKARSVTETEINLGQQEEGLERFDSVLLSRIIVRMVISFFDVMRRIIPGYLRTIISNRIDPDKYKTITDEDDRPPFDLLRASVNLMIASAVVSYATSQTLPLSTTYVTFMVAMGTSFADQAWGRESAVYRVTGVLTVIGGWFMTAVMAFTISCLLAVIIFYTKAFGVIVLVAFATYLIWQTHHEHRERLQTKEDYEIFNLKKIKDAPLAISTTFEHVSLLLREIRESLDNALEALFVLDEYRLREERNKTKKIQLWVNIIIANVFKAMRLLQRSEAHISLKYAQTIRRLQKLADGHRDIIIRSYEHVSNHHKGLLDVQIEDLQKVKWLLHDILLEVESTFDKRQTINYSSVIEKDKQLRKIAENLNQDQIDRIRNGESKTRLSILYYAIVGNAMMLSKQNLKLLEIFEESFGGVGNDLEFDLD